MQPESKTDDKPGAAARNSGIRLFNGKDSTRWITRNGNTNNWSVENGILKADGGKDPNARNFLFAEENFVLTETDYSNFILRFDFRLDRCAVAAVTFRADPEDMPWMIEIRDVPFGETTNSRVQIVSAI